MAVNVDSNVQKVAVGIDFGGTKMLGTLVQQDGKLLAEYRVPTPYDGPELLDSIVEVFNVLNAQSPISVVGLGVGAAGLVDRQGILRFGPNVGHLSDLPILDSVRQRLSGYEIAVDNDATCATWAECLLGAGQQVKNMALVTLGTGIGGGLVIDGKIMRGHSGFAGEPGHMTIQADGVVCICGKIGCWEAYCSGRALRRMGNEAVFAGRAKGVLQLAGAVDDVRGEHVTQAARQGDSGALAVMDDFAKWLAVGASNIIAILDPERVVVGGGLAEEADLYIDRAREYLEEILFGSKHREQTPLVVATLGERAGSIGAAMLVLQNQI